MKMTVLQGKRVTLRPVEQDDQALIAEWRSQSHVLAGLFSHDPPSLAQQQEWFDDYCEREDELLFVIETVDGVAVGTAGLTRIDHKNRKAEYGRMLIGDRTYLHQGLASEATRLLLGYAFGLLKLHRVYLEVLSDNDEAIRMYKRCGFRVEGRRRDAHFALGEYHDVLGMAILQSDYAVAMREQSLE
jgi:diamine N-acetyltransferase